MEKEEKRDCLAGQLITLGKGVVTLSQETSNRQKERISEVTRKQEEAKNPASAPLEEWPSLLSQLREIFWGIERNLTSINETLDRLEI